ncbi:hypothetical protein ACFC1I_06880 [Microbacterium sp. NPDC056044]|uniref:hypothetical protein n=1 Tax=Microbacterium sp. NPDC056044 TaxID=3345690 RepID=UPI0035D6CC10
MAEESPTPATGTPAPPRWARELLGVLVAVAIGIAVVAAVTASARADLLFHDADSLVTTLIVRSIAIGQPQDWALSSVLFLPETAVLGLLTLFGLGVEGTLALAGVVNVVALYGALRVAAGTLARGRAPIAGALLALGAFGLLAASEASPSRDALELASLLTTTTYYSATVIGVVLTVGIARRGLDRARGAVPWGAVAGVGLVAAASVLTNPLFAVWATVPLGLVLGVVAIRRRGARWLVGGLAAGTAIGFAGRIPLAPFIANTGAGYFDPSLWRSSLEYYGALLADRWSAPWGAASVVLLLVLWGGCIAATVLLARRSEIGATVVAACGWAMPLLVVGGAVVAGTHAARYLQPAVFAPVLGLASRCCRRCCRARSRRCGPCWRSLRRWRRWWGWWRRSGSVCPGSRPPRTRPMPTWPASWTGWSSRAASAPASSGQCGCRRRTSPTRESSCRSTTGSGATRGS